LGETLVSPSDTGPAPISTPDIIESIQRILNRDLAVTYLPSRPGDFPGRAVSAAKAAQLLDWHPTTSFYDGLQRYIDWYLDEHPESQRPTPSDHRSQNNVTSSAGWPRITVRCYREGVGLSLDNAGPNR
jgi:UDP-glucose 4-epimerase